MRKPNEIYNWINYVQNGVIILRNFSGKVCKLKNTIYVFQQLSRRERNEMFLFFNLTGVE